MTRLNDTAERQAAELARLSGDLEGLAWELDEALRNIRGGHEPSDSEALAEVSARAANVLRILDTAVPHLKRLDAAGCPPSLAAPFVAGGGEPVDYQAFADRILREDVIMDSLRPMPVPIWTFPAK